ncbi:MAG: sulfotransferase domain-containing protein [Anaerolineales bacterium]|nr:sulfotransferase domain-containing protein [Anaerolineales bacterium]
MPGVILSAGMVKAGSAWYFNMTNDLAISAGWDDPRQIRTAYGLKFLLTEANVNMGKLTFFRFLLVMYPHIIFGRQYVIKTHYAPTPIVKSWISKRKVLTTYVYRDPRDVIVSTMDHSKRVRERGIPSAFTPYNTLEKTLPLIKENISRWRQWRDTPEALLVRYEDLLQDTRGELDRLCEHLGFDVPESAREEIVSRYTARKTEQSNLHFHKGVAGRYIKNLTEDQISLIEDQIGDSLQEMGYLLTSELLQKPG